MTTMAEHYTQKGRQEGAKAMARNLLAMGLSIEGIAQGTGLSIAEIKALQKSGKADSLKSA